jgi:beta-glucosidase
MSLDEKCGLLSGLDMWRTKAIERLNIPRVWLSDGPGGLRKQTGAADHLGLNASYPATCWPAASTIANSWDPALAERVGGLLGEEAKAMRVNMVLGPGLNIKRSALCGRNFEYFSEDPFLAGKLAARVVLGVQSAGVSACVKHFAGNNQELNRMHCDSVIDERALREIYLTNFEIAVREGRPKALMSSYNPVNGVYANENEWLLRTVLRDEWGFEGAVVSDWGGSNDHAAGVLAGSNLEMPHTGGDSDRQLKQAVLDGRVSEEVLDERVGELLDLILSVQIPADAPAAFSFEDHHAAARYAAEQSIVLLKNDDNILPMVPGVKAAIIGGFAEKPHYQGAGSSNVNPTRLDSVLDLLDGFDIKSAGFAKGFRRKGQEDAALKGEAVRLAGSAEIALLFLGLPEIYETEGLDRPHAELPRNQTDLLEAVYAVNNNVVVILSAGGYVEMPWIDKCKGLVFAGLGGQAGAGAVLDVLTGRANPSGKLSETYPLAYGDAPVSAYFPGRERTAEYRESIYVGYRYFDKVRAGVRFPFGFGLSYTVFEYSDLKADSKTVTFTVANTGGAAGAETAQVYIGLPGARVFRPEKELKGFAKVFLEPGEHRRVTIPLDETAFRYYNVKSGRWNIEPGSYSVMVGASSRDIRLAASVVVDSSGWENPYSPDTLPSYYTGRVHAVPDAEFEALLGHKPPEGLWGEPQTALRPQTAFRPQTALRPLTVNDTFSSLATVKSPVGRLVHYILKRSADKNAETPDLNALFRYHAPFRALAKMTGGAVTMEMAEALPNLLGGHFWRGLGGLIRGWFRKFRFDHPGLTQFLVFFAVSNGVTLLQLALMPLFKALLGLTPLVDTAFRAGRVGRNFDGSPFFIFDYAAGELGTGGGGGLAYFLAVQLTIALAQVANFFLQRKVTFQSNGKILRAVCWYALAYAVITIGAATAQGLYKAPVYAFLIGAWGAVGETAADVATMLINSAISFWVFFPIFRLIFRRKDEA